MHRCLAACLGLLLFAALPAGGQPDLFALRAAFLYNFTKYLQWPDESRGELRLCVLGSDPSDPHIDSLHGKSVRSQRLVVRQQVIAQDIPNCDYVFIPASAKNAIPRARLQVGGYPILIVAEGEDTLQKGAMVALFVADNRLQFEIDNATARQQGLQFGSQLLRLARKVL